MGCRAEVVLMQGKQMLGGMFGSWGWFLVMERQSYGIFGG